MLDKLVMTLLLTASLNAISTEIIKLANGEWAPYNSEQFKHYGYTSHIVTEAFAAVGKKVEYGFTPWKRAYELAKKNPSWHGSLIWSKSPEREEDFYFSNPVVVLDIVFFHKAETPLVWTTLKDLKGYTIGTTGGYFYGKEFAENMKAGIFTVDEASSDVLGMRKLVSGRTQLFPLAKEAGLYLLRIHAEDYKFETLSFHPAPVTTEMYHLILSKNIEENKDLLPLFNQGLKIIQNSGLYSKIIQDNLDGKYF